MGGVAGRIRRAVALAVAVIACAIAASPASPAGDYTFVQVQRVNSLELQFGTDTFATQNAFGGAWGSVAQSSLQSALASGIADGSISWLLEMPGLTDLSGTSNAAFDVGFVGATPVSSGGDPAYDGTSDLDWWYVPDAADVAPDGSAIHRLTGTFAAKTFAAGPGPLAFTISLAGAPATLAMSATQLQAVAGDSSAPLESTNGFPPGHEPGENLPDSLTSFESMSSGKLRGGISARSLYNAFVPAAVAQYRSNYDISHTILDLLIGGCTYGGFITVVSPTQPDTFDPAVGSGTYAFTFNSTTHRVTGCTHDGGAATLDDCLDAAAYSSYFTFTTDRVIDREQVVVRKLLTVNRAGSGSGTVTSSPAGIDCGADCTEWFDPGSQVTLTAGPAAGSRFDGWTGCDNPSGATCEMTMDGDTTVQATFTLVAGPSGTGDGGGGGGGTGDGATPAPTGGGSTPAAADTTAPAFGSATISPRRLRKSATVRYTVSEAAQVTFVFEAVQRGRRVGRKCVKQTSGNARKRRCNRFVAVARLSAAALAGANQKKFAKRIGKRTLRPGRYRLTLRATDAAGNASQPERLTFAVARRS
jgi:hypothetical protein